MYAQLQQSSHTINSRCRCGIWECVKEHFTAGLNGQIGEHDEIINRLRFAIHFHRTDNVRISDNMRKEIKDINYPPNKCASPSTGHVSHRITQITHFAHYLWNRFVGVTQQIANF